MGDREVTHRYVDPVDQIWLGLVHALGWSLARSDDVYASFDGARTLTLGSHNTLDSDDCLAQMVLHEVCHAVLGAPAGLGQEDWGLCNTSNRDLDKEHACLRLQAALLTPLGLRQVLAPTTEHRAYYDKLPNYPVQGTSATARQARNALARAWSPPWFPHLQRALVSTIGVAKQLSSVLPASHPSDLSDTPSLWSLRVPTVAHPNGLPLHPASSVSCSDCTWHQQTDSNWQCHRTGSPIPGKEQHACYFHEPEENVTCTTCGACCREAFDAVELGPEDHVPKNLVVEYQGRRTLRRVEVSNEAPFQGAQPQKSQPHKTQLHKTQCAALTLGSCPPTSAQAVQSHCTIYNQRPQTCRDFTRATPACLQARQHIHLS